MARVTLFDGPEFGGRAVELDEGNLRFSTREDFNDQASSIRVERGYGAILYEHANEHGGYGLSVDLLEDCPRLDVYGFDKKVSFVRVFRTVREQHVWERGSLKDGQYVPGHWRRKRAGESAAPGVGSPAAVSPALLPPTQPPVEGGGVRDHRGSGSGTHAPPPVHGPGFDGTVRDHRSSKIKHLFVLMLENRSFDHMLGFSGITGTDARTGEKTSIDGLTGNESNSWNGVAYKVIRGAPDSASHDPAHGFTAVVEQLCGAGAPFVRGQPYPPISNSGFVSNYARSQPGNPDGAMRCFTREQVPVITKLAEEFVVCDRWFSSMPGPTEPNRWFVHAGTASDRDNNSQKREYADGAFNPWGGIEFSDGSIFKRLEKKKVKYRIYACDEFPNVALLDGISRTFDIDDFDDFAKDVSSPSYDAAYTFIEPSYDVFRSYRNGSSQHPLGSAKAGEMLIKRTYEALRKSPLWDKSMLVITYDEHGGFYDHVAPPPARPTGSAGRATGFLFDQLGPRVPTLIVSPLIPKNLVDHRTYEHSSIISTLINLFELGPLTARTSTSSDFKHLATLDVARTDAPMTLPDPMPGIMARTMPVGVEHTTAETPDALIEEDPTGLMVDTLASGLAQHLEVTPEAEHPAIRERVKSLKTHGEALAYLQEVAPLVKQARLQAGVARSAVTRRVGGAVVMH